MLRADRQARRNISRGTSRDGVSRFGVSIGTGLSSPNPLFIIQESGSLLLLEVTGTGALRLESLTPV